MQYVNYYKSPLGKILLSSNGNALTGLCFEGQKYFAEGFGHEHKEKDLPIFYETKKWLDIYFSGKEPDFLPKIYLIGTPFRIEVWNILKKIPYGKTITYSDIAKEIAKQKDTKQMSAQAVGGAVGHNPISIIVPCHRVVGVDGNLTGYAGGIERKIKLLELEKVDIKDFFVPKTNK